MNHKKKILAICGSTRSASSNLRLIQAIAALTQDMFDIQLSEKIDALPHFNPDITDVPESVTSFRAQINSADAILISTPEYAMGVPGTLKNALDWTVSTASFSQKPTALITASTSGLKAHEALLGTLKVIEAEMNDGTQLVISFINIKVNKDGVITDVQTKEDVMRVMKALGGLAKEA